MQLNTWYTLLPDLDPDWQSDPSSIYRCFEGIKDRRGTRGKRYPLALILTLIILAKLAGEDTVSGVVSFCRYRRVWLSQQLQWPRRFPCHSTFTTALHLLDGNEVVQQVAQWILRAQAEAALKQAASDLPQVALDGKTLRGTLGHENSPSVHVLSWYECASGLVLGQQVVEEKENEIVAARAFLTPSFVKGRLVSADAMHTQRAWCTEIRRPNGHYLLIAKGNQPELREDLVAYFEDPDLDPGALRMAHTIEKGHGRQEKRILWASTEMNDWFALKWTGFSQAFKLLREVTEKGEKRTEIVYGLTSVEPQHADANFLLEAVRKHWAIEN